MAEGKVKNFLYRFLIFFLSPVLIPYWVLLFLVYYDGFYFVGYGGEVKIKIAGLGFLNLVFFPLLTIFLLWRLKFVKNYLLIEKNDRTIILFALSIFYFWTFYVFKNLTFMPLFFIRLYLVFFISVSLAPLLNYFVKFSFQLSSIGTILFALIFERMYLQNNNYYSYPLLIFTILATGILTSLSIYKKEYENKQIKFSFYLPLLSNVLGNILVKYV